MNRFIPSLLGLYVLAGMNVASGGELADAAERQDNTRVQQLLQAGVDANEPQVDGATALHWAVQLQDTTLAERLLNAGANAMAANRVGATPLMLAAINGDAAMLTLLLDHGANVNAPLSVTGDTALMLAARTGLPDAVELLLQRGAEVDAHEQWGGATALMWAVSEGHEPIVQRLIEAGADVNVVTAFIPRNTERNLQFEGSSPAQRAEAERKPVMHASGELRPLHFAAREGHLAIAERLLDAGANIDARAADGKDALGLAIFNGNYALASRLIERGANVNQADAEEFTPLFWAVDRRNMETAPNFPWTVTDDPLPLVRKLLEAGADPNHLINATPKALMREGEPRLVFATALTRAAFSGDPDLVKLLLEFGADPQIRSSDDETMLSAAAGTGFIYGFHKLRPASDRLEVIRVLVERGLDVNWHDDYGITPLMAAANLGDTAIIQYLVDQGADLGAFDLGEKNDGVFGASIEPLMPIDYAIGVGTFRPNNAIVFNEPAVNLMLKLMQDRGIAHRTSECTLRGFTCSAVNMDPRDATPADIDRAREFQTGWQVDDNAKGSGLEVKPAQP